MATKAQSSALPGRRHGGLTGREAAVQKYREMINERTDLSPEEKKQAVAKYATGMGVDLEKVPG